MAWDSKAARRHQSSNASRSNHASNKSTPAIIKAKSTHIADATLQPFLNPLFDPADYLNATLPSLHGAGATSKDSISLTELSIQTQTLLSHLSTHTTRLTTTLTQLTDEILRSGSRLAYEVEVLRGETLGLSEALTEGLHDDVIKFVSAGLEQDLVGKTRTRKTPFQEESLSMIMDPPYITQLQTLILVRSRLETIIRTFGDAISWTFPPSEVSVTSSFLSVSAPEPGSSMHSMEEKGQQVSKKLQNEISDLLLGGDPITGIEAATKRVGELKELALVWKGTAEERARIKFVEGLAKMVEDRYRDLLREAENDGRLRQRIETLEVNTAENRSSSGFGFIGQLQKLRGAL